MSEIFRALSLNYLAKSLTKSKIKKIIVITSMAYKERKKQFDKRTRELPFYFERGHIDRCREVGEDWGGGGRGGGGEWDASKL